MASDQQLKNAIAPMATGIANLTGITAANHIYGPATISPTQSTFFTGLTGRPFLNQNKEELLKELDIARNKCTIDVIEYVLNILTKGYSKVEMYYNEHNEKTNFKGYGSVFLLNSIHHLQSKGFMCVIEDLEHSDDFSHKITVYA